MSIYRQAAAVMVFCLLAAVLGCSGTPPDDTKADKAMGRYVERECTLPDGLSYGLKLTSLSGGIIELSAFHSSGDVAELMLYRSSDEGKSWTEHHEDWQDSLTGKDVAAFARDLSGGATVIYLEDWDSEEPQFRVLQASPEGSLRDRGIPSDTFPAYPEAMVIAPDGRIAVSTFKTVIALEPNDLHVEYQISIPGKTVSSVTFFNDRLIVAQDNKLLFYTSETGEELEARDVKGSFYLDLLSTGYSSSAVIKNSVATLQGDGQAFYYCTKEGLYRQSADGQLTECLADGNLLSLSLPSYLLKGLEPRPGGNFLLLYQNGFRWRLLNCYFDETVLTVPSTELKVYSLRESDTARQSAVMFQQKNADVWVNYTTVFNDAEEGNTRGDFLRSLNTELLAGKGPDVLILDNLPLMSYESKGVLVDLRETVREKRDAGEWLDKTEAFKRDDGSIYAIPARFSVPLLVTDRERTQAAHSLAEIAEWIDKAHEKNPDEYPGWYEPWYPDTLIQEWYSVCAPAWTEPDGSANAEELSGFLTSIKTISDIAALETDKDVEIRRSDMAGTTLQWYTGYLPQAVSKLKNQDGLAAVLQAVREKDGEAVPLPGSTEGVYVPGCLLGINSNSQLRELALSFAETTLSPAVQDINLEDGLPVHISSFFGLAKEPENDYHYKYGLLDKNAEFQIIEILWPAPSEIAPFLKMIEGVRKPSPEDEETMQLIIDESKGYFDDQRSLEDTVSSICEKIELRSHEKNNG